MTDFVKFGLVQNAGEKTPAAPNASVFNPSQSETSPPSVPTEPSAVNPHPAQKIDLTPRPAWHGRP